jgi:chemotaxis signal transduction protein
MNIDHESGNSNHSAQGFMQLSIGKVNILLPLQQVASLETVLDIEWNDSEFGFLGKINSGGTCRPVFNLGEDLQFVDELAEERKVCVCFGNDENGFGIICDQVNTLDSTDVELVDLPSCMKKENTPVNALAIKDKQVMSVTNAEAIGKLITLLQQDQ